MLLLLIRSEGRRSERSDRLALSNRSLLQLDLLGAGASLALHDRVGTSFGWTGRFIVGEFAPRFYRVLYASLLAPEFRRSSKNNLYLNLLYRVLKTCKNRRIVMALLKRVLQCALMMPANMACGLLYMVSTVLSERKELKVNAELKKLMEEHALDLGMEEEKEKGEVENEKEKEKEKEEKESEKEEKKSEKVEEEEEEEESSEKEEESEKEDNDDDDDDESEEEQKEESKAMEEEEGEDEVADLDEAFFQDSDEQSANENENENEKESDEEEKKESSDDESDAEKPHQPNQPKSASASSSLPPVVYDIHARDPIFSNADRTFLFELSLLAHHYHPTVAHFANQLLEGSRVSCSGDPLIDFSNKAFLDKFAYKHPKQKDLDNARDRGSEAMQSHKKAKSLTQPPVNSEAFLNQKEEDVAIEDQFFYKFFKERAKRTGDKKKKSKKDAEGMSEEEEEEIDAFANQLATDLINEHMGDEADDFLNEFEEEENGRFLEEGRNDGVG